MNQHTLPKAIWKTIVAVFLLMPLVVTVVYAFSARWVHILPEGFTLHHLFQPRQVDDDHIQGQQYADIGDDHRHKGDEQPAPDAK